MHYFKDNRTQYKNRPNASIHTFSDYKILACEGDIRLQKKRDVSCIWHSNPFSIFTGSQANLFLESKIESGL